jgi:hypothetical protein
LGVPECGGSGEVGGRAGGICTCEVRDLEVSPAGASEIGGSGSVARSEPGTSACKAGAREKTGGGEVLAEGVADGMVRAGAPGTDCTDRPETGGSGSVVGREPSAGELGALEKTGGVVLPEGVTDGRARVGGRGGAGCVVRCNCTVGGREKFRGALGPVTPGVMLAGGRIEPGDD